jgi:hypothetical protein
MNQHFIATFRIFIVTPVVPLLSVLLILQGIVKSWGNIFVVVVAVAGAVAVAVAVAAVAV